MHPRPIRIKNSHDFDAHFVHAAIVEHQRFSGALPFVIARSRTDRIHIAAITLDLRVHIRIAIDLACRRLQHACIHSPTQSKRMHRSKHACLHRLDRVVLIVTRRSWACKVVNLIDLKLEWFGDIMKNELKVRLLQQVLDVQFLAREKVVQTNNFIPLRNQSIAQMRTKKACATCDKNSFAHWRTSLANAILHPHVSPIKNAFGFRRHDWNKY